MKKMGVLRFFRLHHSWATLIWADIVLFFHSPRTLVLPKIQRMRRAGEGEQLACKIFKVPSWSSECAFCGFIPLSLSGNDRGSVQKRVVRTLVTCSTANELKHTDVFYFSPKCEVVWYRVRYIWRNTECDSLAFVRILFVAFRRVV